MLSQKGNNAGFSGLARALALSILVMGGGPATAAAETSWIFDAAAGAQRVDNVTNASSSAGKKGNDTSFLAFSAGKYFQVADYTGLAVSVELKKDASSTYSGLSLTAAGLSFRVTHKMGLGPSAVRLGAYASASDESYGDKNRDSILYKAGVSGSRWIGDRVKVGLGYEFDKRSPKNSYSECTGGYGGSCTSRSYTDVYALQGHAAIANAEISLTEKDALLFSYRYRTGDVISVDTPTLAVYTASSAVSGDEVFPTLLAYRISAATQTVSIGVSHELARKMSLNVNYSYSSTAGKGGVDYRSGIFNLAAAYSF